MLQNARLLSRTAIRGSPLMPARSLSCSVGDKLPSVDLHLGFPPKKHNLAEFARDKSIVLLGLPGAFTPT